MGSTQQAIHEVDLCSRVAATIGVLVNQNPGVFPFNEARVEGFGTGAGRRKRKGLRFHDYNGKPVLCGEVRLPGRPEGRPPYDDALRQDAEQKANNAGIRFFFTWNVNTFVLWDRSLLFRVWQEEN